MDTLLGTTLGGYMLQRLLGSGGMGAVYLAEDASIGQQVAIKVVRTDDSDYNDVVSLEQAADRFRLEARAIASLDHLNILPLYRYGEEETASGHRAHMIMQYRPEGSLLDWLRRRSGTASAASQALTPQPPKGLPTSWPLGIEEAVTYLHQAASALQYAHDRGIIHRDVKPANFLLRFDMNAPSKVLLLLSDFGLAKFYAVTSATSHVFGTPIYMAPEQFEGTAGPESDQYALAIMFYHLLAGHPPFEGDPIYLMHQHLSSAPPPIRTLVPNLPEGIDEILGRALAKQPDQRYPSIMAFADSVAHLQQRAPRSLLRPFTLPTLPSVNPSSAPAQSSTSIFRAATHLSPAQQQQQAVAQTPSTPGNDQHNFSTLALPQQPLDFQASTVLQQPATPASSAITAAEPPVRAQAQITQQSAPGKQRTNRRSALGWICGGTALLVVGAGAGFYIANTQHHGPPPPPVINPPAIQPTISNTGVQFLLHAHSGEVTTIKWSPDSSRLASGSADATVRIWNVAGQQTGIYRGHTQPVLSVSWSSDGGILASGGRDESVKIWNSYSASLRASFALGAIVSNISWQQDNTRLFASTADGTREIIPARDSAIPARLKAATRAVEVSPNGHFLAVGTELGLVNIYALPTLRRLSSLHLHKGPVLSLAWSPDSTLLASGGSDKLVQVGSIATAHVLYTLRHHGAVEGVAWHPSMSSQLATIASDGNLYTWSTRGDAPATYRSQAGACTSLSWGATGIVTGTASGTIVMWKL